jgi:hypothetical protein
MHPPHDPYQAPASALADAPPDALALRPASKWRRLGTYLIDVFCFAIVAMIVAVV